MRWRWALPAVAVVGLVAGLVMLGPGRGAPGAAPPAPSSFDPPTAFADGPGTPLPREADGDPPPVVLDGFHAFLALPGRLQVVDTRTGAVRAEVAPGTGSAAAAVPRAPVLATLGGRPVVVAAFTVTVPGRGTTVGHDAIELVVVDAATLQRAGGARIDLAPSLGDEGRLRGAWPVGAAESVVVVAAELGPDREAVTHALDLAAGRAVWQVPGFAAADVTGGLVLGAQRATGGSRIGALRLADGAAAWTAATPDPAASPLTVWPAGPATVAGSAAAEGGGRSLTLYDAASGRVLARRAVPGAVTCRFDGRLTTVCWHDEAGRAWVAGFDVSSGRTLWELPDSAAARVAPRVSTVWHGSVYGVTDNGPVALDARTGSDLPRSPGIAPDLVNGYVGIVGATIERPRARAYLAIA